MEEIPPPRDLPNPRMESRSPALQVNSLPSEPPGNPGVLYNMPQFKPVSRQGLGTLMFSLYLKKIFIHLFLAMLGCREGFSLVVESGGYSLAVMHKLLTALTSLLAAHRLQSTHASVVVAPGFWSTGSVVVAHGHSCPTASGILPDQGSNLCLLHWQADSSPLNYRETQNTYYFLDQCSPTFLAPGTAFVEDNFSTD